MHKNFKYLSNLVKSNHIDSDEKELIFQLFSPSIIFLILLIMIILYGIIHLIPELKNTISIKYFILMTFIPMFIYIWSWNSIHTKYHNREVSLENQMSYNIIPFFKPDTNSRIYKYLYKYHTLHHLNKGKNKGNYNIVCPLFDYIFNTYNSKVDNKLHFLENKPKTKQEEWLYNNQVFDIRIQNNNIIEYKLENSDTWLTLPFDI